ncbi:MAG TPA: ribonuclease J [Anaerolineales bacterium]|nr:ribonuclease J [Anaerolineales bacterium]
MSDKTLRLVPLGGLGEVGKNMMVVEYGHDILVVDTGIMFPENDMLGIDYIIPDFGYLKDKVDRVRGIVITHGHEDHTGAIHHILEEIPAPIYATALTRGLIEVKLQRAGLLKDARLHTVQAGDTVRLGPFRVEFFHVCHSIPDGVGLAIDTPAGLVVHSGDFKFDHTPVDGWPTDFGKLAELGQRGVLALMADSTNAERPGWTPSEAVIDPAFDDVFRAAPGRILIGTFASLISRIQQAARAAARHDRVLSLVGTSMVDNVRIARQLGYLTVPDGLVVPLDEALKMKPQRVALMCTGTQGEPSSILGRLSTATNRQFDLLPDDTVVLSSHPIPGNEETVHRTINRLLQRGANVIYDAIAPVHVSGHASQEEMKLLMQLIRPQYFVPVHGELRHLKMHASLAHSIGIPAERTAVVENGMVLEFRDGKMQAGERIPGGYVFVDGRGVGDVGPAVMRERESLARDGFVLVNLRLNPKTGKLAGEPEIHTRGFVYAPDAEDLLQAARQKVRELGGGSDNGLPEKIERELGKLFYAETKRRPMVLVFTSSSGS